jgi:ParB family chromosome partitioning protein
MKNLATLNYDQLSLEGGDFQNPREHIDAKLIGELADSIAKQGILYPLVVWKVKGLNDKTVKNVVVDGGRRLRAIGKLKAARRSKGIDKDIPVRFVEAKSLKEARVKALTGNIQRVNLNAYEVAKEMATLKEEGMQQKTIATQLGKSQAWVSRMLSAFTKASELVLAAWRQGKLPDDDVQSIVKLKDHEKQNALLEKTLALRENGKASNGKTSKAARAKARQEVKDKTNNKPKGDRIVRPSADMLDRYIAFGEKAKKTQRYIQGLLAGLRLANGHIADSQLDKEWLEYAAKFYISRLRPESGWTRTGDQSAWLPTVGACVSRSGPRR